VSKDAAPYVHYGVTSQDILDSAMMLIARNAIAILIEDLGQAASAAATLAVGHRTTVMAARTLLQQASITSFGLKAARWLNAIDVAKEELEWIGKKDVAVQLGGAVGTLSGFGGKGIEVMERLGAQLELHAPVLPWHTDRTPTLKVAMAVALAAGTAGKVALDVVLLSQTEVGEVRERMSAGRGGSSALPQKQNPVDAVEILAAVRGVNAQAGLLIGSLVQEQERAAGAWQAEWPAMTDLLLQAGGATSRLAPMLGSLEVDAERMRSNVDESRGMIMAEHVQLALAQRTDPERARAMIERAVKSARESGRPFQDVLKNDPEIRRHLGEQQLARALDPAHALGQANELIDRALEQHREMSQAKK
jgi:3-carboxy-cis,cis-muconate cycloisomerase